MANDRKARADVTAVAAGIVSSAIDRVVAAVALDDEEDAPDEADASSLAHDALLAVGALSLIAVTEMAYGARDQQVADAQEAAPEGQPALMCWTTNSGAPCEDCVTAEELSAGGVDPDQFDFGDLDHAGGPGCECTWESYDSGVTASGHSRPKVEGLPSAGVTITLTASATATHKTATDTGAWDAAANVKNLDNGDGEAEYKQAAAWQDPDADADTKGAYSFWHHLVSADGEVGAANMAACQAVVATLNGAHGVDVKKADWYADRDKVYAHVDAHMADGKVEKVPKLDPMEVVSVRNTMKQAGKVGTAKSRKQEVDGEGNMTTTVTVHDHAADAGAAVDETASGATETVGTDTPDCHMVCAIEGVSTGARIINPGAVTWRTLPISLTADHGGVAEVVGRIVTMTRVGAQIIGEAVYDTGDFAADIARKVAEGNLRWVSLEPDETYESVLIDESTGAPITDWDDWGPDTHVLEIISKITICAMSVVVAGAEPGCIICPIDQPLPEPPAAPVASMSLAASVSVSDEKPPLEAFSDPHRDGRPGSDIVQAGDFFFVGGYICQWGVPHIGRSDKMCAPRSRYPQYPYFRQSYEYTAGGKVATGTLTMGTGHAPERWPDGRWLTPDEVRAHYDNTGCGWSKVGAGEDDYGLWGAGICKPGITKAELWAARSAWSGDWRQIGGGLELVASLNVNVPGYTQLDPALMASGAGADIIVLPTERTRCSMVGGVPMALVAAGISYPDPTGDALRALAASVGELRLRLDQRDAEEAVMAARRARLRAG